MTLAALAKKYANEDLGYVYVMEYKFQTKASSKTLYKVGITKNQPIDRMLEISRSFFQKRRYIPESKLIRFRKVPDYYKLEQELHKLLIDSKYGFKLKFSGSTEFFDIDIDQLLLVYDERVPLLKKK